MAGRVASPIVGLARITLKDTRIPMTHQPIPSFPGIIVSQWGDTAEQLLRARRPGLRVQTVPPGLAALSLPDDAQVLLTRPNPQLDKATPMPAGWPFNLRFVQLVSVGFDFYPPWMLQTPGVMVSTAHGSSSEVIADFVLASILRVQLRLEERRARQHGDWRLTNAPGVLGATVGLLGFGGIGQALSRKLLALGMNVVALRSSAAPLGQPGVQQAASLEALMQASDHLVLVAPDTPQTRHIINARSLAAAKRGMHLVNVARGSLVDQDALRAALDSGQVGWASLDVTEPEPLPEGHWLYSHPQVWLTPHTCAISPQTWVGLVDKLVRSLDRISAGQPPESPIDLARGY